jgi:hypothetical protein
MGRVDAVEELDGVRRTLERLVDERLLTPFSREQQVSFEALASREVELLHVSASSSPHTAPTTRGTWAAVGPQA